MRLMCSNAMSANIENFIKTEYTRNEKSAMHRIYKHRRPARDITTPYESGWADKNIEAKWSEQCVDDMAGT